LLACTELTRVGRSPCGIVFNQQGHADYGYFGYYYGYNASEATASPADRASVT
jgi:hypothetical protein